MVGRPTTIMTMLRPMTLGLAATLLCACSADGAFRDRSHDYRRAQLSEVLVVPEGMGSESLGDSFVVPGIDSHGKLPGRFEVPRPDPLHKDVEEGVVRIQKLNDDTWILLNGSPGQIWPRVRGFLSVSSLPVAHTDAVSGLIDTAWLQPRGEELPKERYRFRIDQGVQRGTSEIHVLQADARAEQSWPPASSNGEREEQMTRALAQYLADSEAASSVSMLAQQNVDSQGKVFVEREGERGDYYLRLLLPFDRGWASLGLALEKAGFVIEDRNRSEGRFWVALAPKEDEQPGWLSRVFGRDQAPEQARYQVRMQPLGEQDRTLRIDLSADEGTELSAEQAESLLKRIKGYLS